MLIWIIKVSFDKKNIRILLRTFKQLKTINNANIFAMCNTKIGIIFELSKLIFNIYLNKWFYF
jgi:hypothetical protein